MESSVDRVDDIAFLELFRAKVNEYLFLGYAPTEVTPRRGEGARRMAEALAKPEFQDLRRQINEMKPRARRLLKECNVPIHIQWNSPLLTGGRDVVFELFDLITENRMIEDMRKTTFLDPLEQAIGVLRNPHSSRPSENASSSARGGASAATGQPVSPNEPIVGKHTPQDLGAKETPRISVDPPTAPNISFPHIADWYRIGFAVLLVLLGVGCILVVPLHLLSWPWLTNHKNCYAILACTILAWIGFSLFVAYPRRWRWFLGVIAFPSLVALFSRL